MGNGTGFFFNFDSATLTDCVATGNEQGALLAGNDISGGSEVTFENCTFEGNDRHGIRVTIGNATVEGSRIVRNGTGVSVNYKDAWAEIGGSHICGNAEYGVNAESGTDEETGEGDFEGGAEATDNYWGAANGPSSYGDPEEPYEDPETGEPADGDGDAVSEGLEPGVSNVRFDPYKESTLEDVGAQR